MGPEDTSELVFLLLVSFLVNLSRWLKAHTFEGARKEKRLTNQSAKLDTTAIQEVSVPLKQVYQTREAFGMGAKSQGPLLDRGQDPGATTEKTGSHREHLCKQT